MDSLRHDGREAVVAESAIEAVKSVGMLPNPDSLPAGDGEKGSAGQSRRETHSGIAGAPTISSSVLKRGKRAADPATVPTTDAPPSSESEIGSDPDARQAKACSNPTRLVPAAQTLSVSDDGTTEATTSAESKERLPRSSKSRSAKSGGDGGHSWRGTQKVIASIPTSNAGDARQRVGHSVPETLGVRADPQNPSVGNDGGQAKDVAKSDFLPPAPKTRRTPKRGGVSDGGHAGVDAHITNAAVATPSREGKGGIDRLAVDAHYRNVDPALIAEIEQTWRMRNLWLKAEIKLTNQCKGVCLKLTSSGDKETYKVDRAEAERIFIAAIGKINKKTGKPYEHPLGAMAFYAFFPMYDSQRSIEAKRNDLEKHCEKLAKRLHVAAFINETKGASFKSLAAIVGEAGDLSKYANPGKLWKRMGLAPYQGNAYSTWRKLKELSGDEWTAAGYKPLRRSAMFVIGGSLIGGMGRGKRPLVGQDISGLDWSPLEKLFVERCRYEAGRDPENMALPPTEEGKESYRKHAQMRAQRYVEKRFLRLLWQAWRGGQAYARSEPREHALIAPNSSETNE